MGMDICYFNFHKSTGNNIFFKRKNRDNNKCCIYVKILGFIDSCRLEGYTFQPTTSKLFIWEY